MALLATQRSADVGAVVTPVAASTSDTYFNTGKEVVRITNGGGSSITVTIPAVTNCAYGVGAHAAHNKTGTVGAGVTKEFGPYDPRLFANGDTSLTTIQLSSATSVTTAVVSVA